MKQSETIANLAKAYINFKAEHPAVSLDEEVSVPTKKGGLYKFKFASLPTIKKDIEPFLTKNGLAVTQFPDEGNKLTTLLIHHSGEFMSAPMDLNEMREVNEHGILINSGPQDFGSILTYARRYAYCAVLGLIGDSTGDNAGRPKPQNAPTTGTQPPPSNNIELPWLNIRKRDGSFTQEGAEAIKHMTEGQGDLDSLLAKFRINKDTKHELLLAKEQYVTVDQQIHFNEEIQKKINQASSIKELTGIYEMYKALQPNEDFKNALDMKRTILKKPEHTAQLNLT